MQSAFSWAPNVTRKCESKHWYACGADGRSVGRSVAQSVGHVITKFPGMGRFIYPWCSAGALRARSPATKGENQQQSKQKFRFVGSLSMRIKTLTRLKSSVPHLITSGTFLSQTTRDADILSERAWPPCASESNIQ